MLLCVIAHILDRLRNMDFRRKFFTYRGKYITKEVYLSLIDSMLSDSPELANVYDIIGPSTRTRLAEACYIGEVDLVKLLLRHGANVNASCSFTILNDVSKSPSGQDYILYTHHSKSNYGKYDDVFPLFIAAKRGHADVMALLMQWGASVNQVNAIGQSSLHAAGEAFCRMHEERCIMQEAMTMLISKGADINLQDQYGRTPLYCACQAREECNIKFFLEHGADYTIRDNAGLSVLDIAVDDYWVFLFLWPCKWNSLELIEAYEVVGNHFGPFPSCFELMSKATCLRKEGGFKKAISQPLQCYGCVKEWETLEELENYRGDREMLILQSVLAKERIYKGRLVSAMSIFKHTSAILEPTPERMNALVIHFLDLFRQNADYLCFAGIILKTEGILRWLLLDQISDPLRSKTIKEVIAVAMECCQKMKVVLVQETRMGASFELVCQLEQTVLIIGALVSVLLKRSETDRYYVQSLLHQLHEDFPSVTSTILNYKCPLLHILLHIKYVNLPIVSSLLPDYDILKMTLEMGFNINSTDSDGNTLLHLVTLAFGYSSRQPLAWTECVERFACFLVEKGIYIYARNKAGQTVLDAMTSESESHSIKMPKLQAEIEKHKSFPSLQRLVAQYLRQSDICYDEQLPQSLVNFVKLH